MILKLKADNVTVVANAWSAGANPGGNVNVMVHGGTIGLTIGMEKFIDLLAAHNHSLDVSDLCEPAQVTNERLGRGG